MAPPTAPRKPRRPSLRDIAEAVGTTRMTVSRCLRDPQTVSEPLRQRIQETARHLNYLPNRAPMMLAQSRSRSIGVLVPSVTNQVFADVLAGIIDETGAADYRAMITHYGHDAAAEERSIAALLAYNADGLILSDRTHTEATRRMIDGAGVAIVEIMDTRKPALQQAVGYDNHAAACDMVTAMIARGHRRIVYLAVRLDERTLQRAEGYREAMECHNLPPVILQSAGKSSFTAGASLMARILNNGDRTDGAFCANDDLAVGAFLECQRRGIRVPDQIMIAGFHGLDVAQALSPQLLTVLTPRYQIGQAAARALLARINGAPLTMPVMDLGYRLMMGDGG
ncbi:substrate-binding domain-containing protein [Roseicitreum antarcticum]|uniref:Transcriptional regulator, LacI family n=1 Tax=Roseicitreum antarcticum TaxID=564137 RepID=A0A1H2TET7_9RHOB|nr:substrate-binding domain-containing protein [Roseicitreum antarcticum]SDW41749.1 transcriptional regulator, LacI family [Roseicitreum antarcticum]